MSFDRCRLSYHCVVNSGLMLFGRRNSVQFKIHPCGGGEDVLGLSTPVIVPVTTGLSFVVSAHNGPSALQIVVYDQCAQEFCAPGCSAVGSIVLPSYNSSVSLLYNLGGGEDAFSLLTHSCS
jgi:hypothetical protein